jgi:hypothetical protein
MICEYYTQYVNFEGGFSVRDLKRIKRILSLVEEIWEFQPDVRFNQLISNLQHLYSSENNGKARKKVWIKEDGKFIESYFLDLFYVKDDQFEEFLESFINGIKERRMD